MNKFRIISIVLLAVGAIFLVAGIYPRLRGGEFASSLFPPAITFLVIGGAVRRRGRREQERGGPADGR